jgi:type II secretory pathway pseudopilin PulG
MVRKSLRDESGISLIEVMVATVIVTVSLMAIAMTMTSGASAMFVTQEQLIAKQKAKETLEAAFASRSTTDLDFDDLESQSKGGIFVEGWQALHQMGPDGIALTNDDADEPIETIKLVGPDGALGTSDDQVRQLTNFERRIFFTPVMLKPDLEDPDIRMMTVEVRFKVNQQWFTVSVHSYISRFA